MAQLDSNYNKPSMNDIKSELRADGEALFERMKHKAEHLEKDLKKYTDNLDGFIKDHPVKATIIAGVVGLLLGKLLAK